MEQPVEKKYWHVDTVLNLEIKKQSQSNISTKSYKKPTSKMLPKVFPANVTNWQRLY